MDIAYVAGLFDGEGCIRVDEFSIPAGPARPKPYRRQQLKVFLAMCHYPTIRALYDQFGGTFSKDMSAHNKNPKHGMRYTWGQSSGYAAEFLRQIEPFLICKKEQAHYGILFQQHIRECDSVFRKHRGVPPNLAEIHAYRRQLITELQRHKAGRFDVPKHLLKTSKRKWPYAANGNVSSVKVELLA